MMWKSFFRVQNFFSAFLNVPIVFNRDSETFQVTPCNTLWRKIKRFVLTNLCLFVIWGIIIYRLLHQLLTSVRDENFTVLDVVIISIALAFCTEGLAHIWTFHFSAGDICYILTQTLRLTKLHCYIPQQIEEWSTALSTGSIVNGGLANFSNKFPALRLQPRQIDFSVKSMMQWEKQVLSLKHSFISSRFNLSKEEFIMYSIALGFNGVPLVCFLTPLMTSSDPASYLMKKIIFPKSPVIAMLAASFFQGLTAFYASLLSLNLILICLTTVCEISAILRTTYPPSAGTPPKKHLKNAKGMTTNDIDTTVGSGTGTSKSSKIFLQSNIKSKSGDGEALPTEGKVDNGENSGKKSSSSLTFPQPQIRIDSYDYKGHVFSKPGSGKKKKNLQGVEQIVETEIQEQRRGSLEQEENNFKNKNPNLSSDGQTSLFQVLSSTNLDNQLPSSLQPFLHPTFGFASTTCVTSSGENGRAVSTSNDMPSNTSAPSTHVTNSNLGVPSPPMLMMKIMEELGPTVVSKPPPSAMPMVKKLMCPTPVHRIKSSAEVLFVKSFQLYLQTKLLVLFINSALFYYFPVVISAGMVLTTLSAYATVKLHSYLPLPLRLSIFLIGLTIATVMLLLMMEATEITRHSEEFLRYWKSRLKRNYSRKQLRTCQRLCFTIGPFLAFKKNTIFGVFSTIQHYLVNLAVIQLV